jgi:hypothetical protein
MKTITINVEEQDLDIFARAKGYKEEDGDITIFTKKAIESIIKNDSIRYLKDKSYKEAEQALEPILQSIINKEFDISIE